MHVGPGESTAATAGVWPELWAWLAALNRGHFPSSETPKGAREAVEKLASSGSPWGRESGAFRGLSRGEDLSPQQQPQQGLATICALPASSWPWHCFRWPHRWQVRAE